MAYLSNYPPGAEFDPNAPWNEVSTPEKEFTVVVSQTLSKSVEVYTDNYTPVMDQDADGYYESVDTSETDWDKVYKNSGHCTPLALIGMFKSTLQKIYDGEAISPKFIKHYMKECEDWIDDELIIMEEE